MNWRYQWGSLFPFKENPLTCLCAVFMRLRGFLEVKSFCFVFAYSEFPCCTYGHTANRNNYSNTDTRRSSMNATASFHSLFFCCTTPWHFINYLVLLLNSVKTVSTSSRNTWLPFCMKSPQQSYPPTPLLQQGSISLMT